MNVFELIEEARRNEKLLSEGTWVSEECFSGKKEGYCWCKVIGIEGEGDMGRGVAPSGCLSRNDADGMTWLRNNILEIVSLLEKYANEADPRSSDSIMS